MSAKIVFVLGYKIPWISEAVMAIYNYGSSGSLKMDKETKQCCAAVSAYVSSLLHLVEIFYRE